MATGISRNLDLSGSRREFWGYNYNPSTGSYDHIILYLEYVFRIAISETYNISTNTSDVNFKLYIKCLGSSPGVLYPDYDIKVDGTIIDALGGNYNTGSASVSFGSDLSQFYPINKSGSAISYTKTGIAHGSTGQKQLKIEIVPHTDANVTIAARNGVSDTPPYFYYMGFNTGTTFNVDLTNIPRGMVNIYNGSSWGKYIPYIYNGSQWVQYMPYVYNGSSWNLYGG